MYSIMNAPMTACGCFECIVMLIPEANAKDLQDIPENVKNGLEIVPVRWIDKVLELALETMPVPLPEEEAVVAVPVAVTPADLQGSVKH